MGNWSAMKFMDHLKCLSGRDQGDLGSAPKDRSLAGRKIVSIVELTDKLVNSPYNQTQGPTQEARHVLQKCSRMGI